MVELTESQKEVLEDVRRRVKEELREVNLRLVDVKVEDIEEEELKTIEKVKLFMEENTECTEKKTDVLGTTDLYEKYCNWNRKKNHENNPNMNIRNCNSINYIENTNVLGKYLTHLNYTQWKAKREGRTIRGYGYLKYKGEADESRAVKEFMEKYAERTGSVKDRVSIAKLLPKFWRDHKERYGIETMTKKLIKYGYHTKAARETQRVEGRYGNEKVVKVGEIVPCILKVKLKNEFFRDEWTQ